MENKYFKYKQKYLSLKKNLIGGAVCSTCGKEHNIDEACPVSRLTKTIFPICSICHYPHSPAAACRIPESGPDYSDITPERQVCTKCERGHYIVPGEQCPPPILPREMIYNLGMYLDNDCNDIKSIIEADEHPLKTYVSKNLKKIVDNLKRKHHDKKDVTRNSIWNYFRFYTKEEFPDKTHKEIEEANEKQLLIMCKITNTELDNKYASGTDRSEISVLFENLHRLFGTSLTKWNYLYYMANKNKDYVWNEVLETMSDEDINKLSQLDEKYQRLIYSNLQEKDTMSFSTWNDTELETLDYFRTYINDEMNITNENFQYQVSYEIVRWGITYEEDEVIDLYIKLRSINYDESYVIWKNDDGSKKALKLLKFNTQLVNNLYDLLVNTNSTKYIRFILFMLEWDEISLEYLVDLLSLPQLKGLIIDEDLLLICYYYIRLGSEYTKRKRPCLLDSLRKMKDRSKIMIIIKQATKAALDDMPRSMWYSDRTLYSEIRNISRNYL